MQLLESICHWLLPAELPQSVDQVEAEISEELEFHIEMRTRDNIRAGMPVHDARRDARERFGDFEANREACRRITLGPRIMQQRTQLLLFIALVVAVAYQGFAIVRLQSDSTERINALTTIVERAMAVPANDASPLVSPEEPGGPRAARVPIPPPTLPHDWPLTTNVLETPWCDWTALGDPVAGD